MAKHKKNTAKKYEEITVRRGFFYPGTSYIYASSLIKAISHFFDEGLYCTFELECPISSDLEYAYEVLECVEKCSERIEREAHLLTVNMRRLRRSAARKINKQQGE